MTSDSPVPAVRAADGDREAAASVVQLAHVEGRLSAEELDERLTRVYGGDIRREGHWRVPPRIVADIGHSDLRLDLTEADIQGFEVLLELTAKSGDVTLIVPEGWSIDLDQLTTKSGDIRNKAVAPLPGGIRLRVTGRVKSGDVVVRHRRRPWWRRGSR